MPDLLPDRLEGGTVNTPGILGLSAGISFVLQNTPQWLYEKEMQLCASLYEQLCGIRGVPAVFAAAVYRKKSAGDCAESGKSGFDYGSRVFE